jgi:protoheme IX farnesyltransferase
MGSTKLKTYYNLVKPGIIYANVLTATAGYLYGSKWHVQLQPFLGVIIGTSLIIAGGCVYNNLLDRNIDKKMARTQKRPLVTGEISATSAFLMATVLTIAGLLTLVYFVNLTVVGLGLVGFVDYVFLYGLAKRYTPFSTVIGSISGAVSVAAGCAAATNSFEAPETMLMLLLIIWQMPHFYAIAMYRRKDYAAAGIPVMPVKRSAETAKLRIMLYIVALFVISILFTLWGYAGIITLLLLCGLTGAWFVVGLQNYRRLDAVAWGKKMFLFSLIVNLGISLGIAIGSITW